MKGWPSRFIHRASDHSPDTPGPFSGQAISTTTAAAAAAAGWTLCFVSISTTLSHILAPSSSDWGATSVCLCQVKPSHFLIFSFFFSLPKNPCSNRISRFVISVGCPMSQSQEPSSHLTSRQPPAPPFPSTRPQSRKTSISFLFLSLSFGV